MRLYYVPRTRAGRVRWMLEELEAPYELARLDIAAKQNRTPEYLAVHPHGKVPALVDGDVTLIESSAICMHLADRFPERGLAPPTGTPERGRYYQWIAYGVATLEPAIGKAIADAEARAPWSDCARVLAAALGEGPFLLGERFSTVDVLVGSMIIWARSAGLLADFPSLAEYAKRLADRPASKRARAD